MTDRALRVLLRRVAERWAEQLEQRRQRHSPADSPYKTLDEIIDEELKRA